MPSYSIGQAARVLGVSGETVRRWADAGRLLTERDGTGNRVIDGASLAGLAASRGARGAAGRDEGAEPQTSVRNSFRGIVTAVRMDEVAAQVEIQAGPHRLVSLVTREAVEDLGLVVGVEATARVKSTNVHIDRPR
ncbi:TOBE domain-containing protein [Streptomyces sp. NPDC051976]|uniref:TOBE domain-containing protein n=1 Tax=Streptomyces sp. NPDC051976 TaxID=3154947 RepID=UPI00342E62D6